VVPIADDLYRPIPIGAVEMRPFQPVQYPLFEEAHTHFVLLAFRSFLVVVVCYAVAIFVNKAYPNGYGVVYVLFALLLAGCIWLLTQGPGLETEREIVIQATGQKAIVYAAIMCTLIQSWGALRQERSEGGRSDDGSKPCI
jgi:hypothetical protein